MAGRSKSNKKKSASPTTVDEPVIKKIRKPYLDTLTKDTRPGDIRADKIPQDIKIRFKRDPEGNTGNVWKGRSGRIYSFVGQVPLTIEHEGDRALLVLKAIKNPETWEIVK